VILASREDKGIQRVPSLKRASVRNGSPLAARKLFLALALLYGTNDVTLLFLSN
jgi:hypothetical protein